MTTPTPDPETAVTDLRIAKLEAEASGIWALREPILQAIEEYNARIVEIEKAHANIKKQIDKLHCSEYHRDGYGDITHCPNLAYKAGLCKEHHAKHKQITESELAIAEDHLKRAKQRLIDLESE